MCLRVKIDHTIQVAEKDIPCVKVVVHRSWFFGLIKHWKSPMYNKDIKRKYNQVLYDIEHLKLDQEEIRLRGDFIINQGYHTFIDEESTKLLFISPEFFHQNYKKHYAIIPKGAEYCIGEWGTLVSNKLIVFSSKKKFDKYVASKV